MRKPKILVVSCVIPNTSLKKLGHLVKKNPRLDNNTIMKVGGIEDGIPHFHVDQDDIFELLLRFDIKEIRHIDDCSF